MARRLKLGVLASGRGSDLQSLLDAHKEGKIESRVSVVISDNPEARALVRARENDVPAEVVRVDASLPNPERRERQEKAIEKLLKEREVDLVVLAGYMRILSPGLVRQFPNRIINIHPALLPSFPGVHGQRQALDWGVRIAGCTVHFLDEQVDHGPILLQAALSASGQDTEETLSQRILAVEHQLLPRSVHLIEQDRVRVEGRRASLDPDESWTKKYPTLPGVLYGFGY